MSLSRAAANSPETISQLEACLKEIVGQDNVLSEPVDLSVYECDGETLDVARPDLVVLPGSTMEVSEVLKCAHRFGVPVTPRGAGTGLSGGATPVLGGISLTMTRMTRIIELDSDNLLACVEVGVTNQSVSKAAHKYGLYFAPDPSSQMASTIGGNIAENAGGAHTLKYGTTVNHVLGVKAVLADGSIIECGGKARDCIGLDLLGALIGSEGTLAVVTEATLRLTPRPLAVETMVAYFPTLGSGGQTVSDVVASGVIPAAMEMIDQLTLTAVEDALKLGLDKNAGALLIIELDGPTAEINIYRQTVAECATKNGALNIQWAGNEDQRAAIWRARKAAFASLGRISPHGYVLDGVIPRSKLAQAIREIESIGDKYQLLIANVYHAGDGNLHPCLLYHRENLEEVKRVIAAGKEIMELCVNLGGALSGEHGIGIEKLEEMPFAFNAAELKAMELLRLVFDPNQLLNPGKVVPTPAVCGESGRRPLLRHKLALSC